ncbi:MAG TPA: hypothetical protein DHV39_07195 [Verrucomicrobiales bacterium]|nr:hypothetical protein [Verrucomicrobiales bacterium]
MFSGMKSSQICFGTLGTMLECNVENKLNADTFPAHLRWGIETKKIGSTYSCLICFYDEPRP